MKEVVIVDGLRTPIGSFMGSLSPLRATDLAAVVLGNLLDKHQISKDEIDEVILGQVLQGGSGQAPARQACLNAKIASSTPCTTINKVCGSGLKAVMLAAGSIMLEDTKIALAGGMESMSNAPYVMPKVRSGLRMGHYPMLDLILHDGLTEPNNFIHMGIFGEMCAKKFSFSRSHQDEFAISSYEKALAAQSKGIFAQEIIPIAINDRKKTVTVSSDEELTRYMPEKFKELHPAFEKDGTITAANSSKINDGAAALLLMSKEEAQRRNVPYKASIVAMATAAQDPAWFTTAPVLAIKQVLKKANLRIEDIGCFEINEAFSAVTMAAIKELSLDEKKVNVFGGAVALGHPIGCSGARILVTLLSAMKHMQKQYGLATLCLGGGEAVAMIVRGN